MPNGCAVPSNVVMLAGFSSTGDATRDAAVSLLAACLEEPATARTPLEVALEAEEQLYDRFADAAGSAAASETHQRALGVAYKSHLHVLWKLLSDATPASTSKKGTTAPGSHYADGDSGAGSIGEQSRRALLEGVFTTKQLLDSIFT
mmetsp:Transcript_23797/g.65418  ORF Transcript_23797/g.65418 Transcript_23797/m.65418 type:complete len:147 (-) Transcript_23797:106-546(-)